MSQKNQESSSSLPESKFTDFFFGKITWKERTWLLTDLSFSFKMQITSTVPFNSTTGLKSSAPSGPLHLLMESGTLPWISRSFQLQGKKLVTTSPFSVKSTKDSKFSASSSWSLWKEDRSSRVLIPKICTQDFLTINLTVCWIKHIPKMKLNCGNHFISRSFKTTSLVNYHQDEKRIFTKYLIPWFYFQEAWK